MTEECSYAFWAKSEREARDMQALGWQLGQEKVYHHNQYALLLVWQGDGEPPMSANDTNGNGDKT
jgi:hypothetical protein